MAQQVSTPQKLGIFAGFIALICAIVAAPAIHPAFALSKKKNEKARLERCEVDICQLILTKKPRTGWLSCNVDKTWIKKDIKKGAKKKKISWISGDAQCSVTLNLERATVIGALEKSKFEIRLRRHYVNCLIENKSGVDKLHIALAPKLKFKNGRVKKVWVNVKKVEGPAFLKSLIWTTAKLEDGLGIFHSDIVDEINDFVHKKCEKRHGKDIRRAAKRRAKRKRAKKQRAKK